MTAERWKTLVAEGVVSRQENDQYQAQYQAQIAGVQALEKAVAAQRSNVAAAEANVARLDEVQSYRVVKAPFDGVVTLRNVDVGALVNAGNTLLFRIAQTGTLRTYVNVPQTNASSIRPGQAAQLTRFESARPPLHRHRRADRERARSHQPHHAGGSPGAESRWRAVARHVRPGRLEQRRARMRRC